MCDSYIIDMYFLGKIDRNIQRNVSDQSQMHDLRNYKHLLYQSRNGYKCIIAHPGSIFYNKDKHKGVQECGM